MKLAFFETEGWRQDYYSERLPGYETVFNDKKVQETDVSDVRDADVIVSFTFSDLKKENLKEFHDLELLVTQSTGYDHIDLDYCRDNDITVCNVPAYGERTVAEYSIALLTVLTRKIYKAIEKVKEMNFSREGLRGNDLEGKTLGIIGTGKIGRNVIDIAHGFDMDIIAYDAFPKEEFEEEHDFTYVDLDELLRESDAISLHVPLLDSTHHLLDDEAFEKMEQKPYIINTSRGKVIDTEALQHALEQDLIKGAALDVIEYESEIEGKDDSDASLKETTEDLIERDDVIVTPHSAFNTEEAIKRILDRTIQNIKTYADGTIPETDVT